MYITQTHAYTHIGTETRRCAVSEAALPRGSPELPYLLCIWPPAASFIFRAGRLVFFRIIKNSLWKWLSALQRASAVVSVCVMSGQEGRMGRWESRLL